MTITCALIQTVEKIAGETDKVRIITKERVTELIMSAGACTACIYENGEATFKEFGPVIFASGGFGADFTNNSLLALKDRFFCTSDRTQYRVRSPRLAASFQMVLTRCEFCPGCPECQSDGIQTECQSDETQTKAIFQQLFFTRVPPWEVASSGQSTLFVE